MYTARRMDNREGKGTTMKWTAKGKEVDGFPSLMIDGVDHSDMNGYVQKIPTVIFIKMLLCVQLPMQRQTFSCPLSPLTGNISRWHVYGQACVPQEHASY